MLVGSFLVGWARVSFTLLIERVQDETRLTAGALRGARTRITVIDGVRAPLNPIGLSNKVSCLGNCAFPIPGTLGTAAIIFLRTSQALCNGMLMHISSNCRLSKAICWATTGFLISVDDEGRMDACQALLDAVFLTHPTILTDNGAAALSTILTAVGQHHCLCRGVYRPESNEIVSDTSSNCQNHQEHAKASKHSTARR